ncbi:MAG: type III-B CRISPR module RAMP protein Cmr4, partial [Victivallaceae bacterium]
MEKKLMSIFARTPIHVGAGNSVGAIDSPIMRERHTRIPLLPGSSIKGVLADLWSGERKGSEAERLFGSEDPKNAQAGRLLIGEGRLVAFPVRSGRGAFAWITCPLALHRLERDLGFEFEEIPSLADMECEACAGVKSGDKVVLEEYLLKCSNEPDDEILNALKRLSSDSVWDELDQKLVIVSD